MEKQAKGKTLNIYVGENGKQSNSSDNSYFIFELNKDGKSYTISAKDRLKLHSVLVIPSKYKNLPVTNIKYNGFQSCKTITSVTIPSSVVSIDSLDYKKDIGAFAGCSSLSKVYFEKESKIQVIGIRAFSYCTKLEEVYLRSLTLPNLAGLCKQIESAVTMQRNHHIQQRCGT